MDTSQFIFDETIEQLKKRVESDPASVSAQIQECLKWAKQTDSPENQIQALMLMSRCACCNMDYRSGIRHIKEALSILNTLDNDDYLAEILHIHALNYWGLARYYTAQQYWINALEHCALSDSAEIQIECLIGLGNIWRANHDFQLAGSTHKLAVTVAGQNRIKWLEDKACILWAWDLYMLSNYVEMLNVLDEAAEALKSHSNAAWKAQICDFRGLAYLGLQKMGDAERAISNAEAISRQSGQLWIQTQTCVSRARLERMNLNLEEAARILNRAESIATQFDHGELLTQIYFQQAAVAEESGDFRLALATFKKYRQYSQDILREQTIQIGRDRAQSSKRQLEQKAGKLISRIRGQYESTAHHLLPHCVNENFWWEQLILFKTALIDARHTVIIIEHKDPKVVEICTELIHSLCDRHDLLSRLSDDKLGLLLAEKNSAATDMYHVIKQMLAIYPWHRKHLSGPQPRILLKDILLFPFTLEQLEDELTQ